MPYYYLIIFIILAAISFYEIFSSNKSKVPIFRLIAYCLVFSTAAFRYETGVDWRVYTALYESQAQFSEIFSGGLEEVFAFGYEPGYALLCSLTRLFGTNIQVLFFFAALLNIILLHKFISRFSNYQVLVLTGYYCFVFFILDMSGLRQALALNIALLGYKYIVDRKFLKYLIIVIIAAQFHRTAYLLIVLYPFMSGTGYAIKKYGLIYLISLFVVLLKIRWLEKMVSIVLPMLTGTNAANDNIVNYLFQSEFDAYSSIVKIAIPAVIATYLYIFKDTMLKDALGKMIFKGVLIYGIVNNMLFELPEMNGRINAYVIIFIALGFCLLIECSSLLGNRIIFYLCTVLYLFLYAGVYFMEGKAVLPYAPYQNYIIHEVFDIPSTGQQRLDNFGTD